MDTYRPPFLRALQKAIACTPNRNFDSGDYDERVVLPARRLRQLADELGDTPPSQTQVREAIETLLGILEAKGVDLVEREERIHELLEAYDLLPLFADVLLLHR